MFSQTAKAIYQIVPGTEGNAVKTFRDSSAELKKMREIAIKSRIPDTLEFIAKIDSALTFAKILEVTDRFDFVNSNDPSVKSAGPLVMKVLLFCGGFVRNDANFAYYISSFRDKMINHMAKKEYSASTEIRSQFERK